MGLHNVEASRENILSKKYSLWSAFAVSSIHHEFLPHLQWSTHHLARVADDSVPGVTDNLITGPVQAFMVYRPRAIITLDSLFMITEETK
jgi:hypothetical protein